MPARALAVAQRGLVAHPRLRAAAGGRRGAAARAAADPAETQEWIDSLDAVLQHSGPTRAKHLLQKLLAHGRRKGAVPAVEAPTSAYHMNSVSDSWDFAGAGNSPPSEREAAVEARIENLVRWNATMLVHQANKLTPGLGGHIATFASVATIFEVAQNHFIRGKEHGGSGDQVFWQPHASPGVYARAFLEGRLPLERMTLFRQEAGGPGPGLSSYPHPHLMPDFWEFPTSSMGLAAVTAIYQARFNRYLHNRGLAETSQSRVWAFLGDGEMDEAESTGTLAIAARERLDNLIFAVNCNLQRLDGPVRGNNKVVQELEGIFAGAGWRVIKCLWGREWEDLLARDPSGELQERLENTRDGDWQLWGSRGVGAMREQLFNTPALRKLVQGLSDEQLARLRPGGHDPRAVHRAFRAACQPSGRPTVVLFKTVKGYGLGDGIAGSNTTHMAKVLSPDKLASLRDRLAIPVPDTVLSNGQWPLYTPPQDSPEIQHLLRRRQELGGPVPRRTVSAEPLAVPPLRGAEFSGALSGSGNRPVSTTGAFGGMLQKLLKHGTIGQRIVPIVPDEARTFGMEGLFATNGIYNPAGQQYRPPDADSLLAYREAANGQVLQEGICEAGAMASFTCAGTAYATHGLAMLPFYCFYSMFGFQRTGDQIWQFGDIRGRGFLMGGTAGRTTLNGEGLQHEDGQSLLQASVVPNLRCYDPAFAYEMAVIVQDGMRRMLTDSEDCFYYITMYNENYAMPPMPEGTEEGILKGIYRVRQAAAPGVPVQLLGSGTILQEALRAQELLAAHGVAADVWSVTSYQMLRRDALEVDRANRLSPQEAEKTPYVRAALSRGSGGPVVAATDFVSAVPDMIARWVPGMVALGTDGYGRSDTRRALRRHFEVDAESIAAAALSRLARDGAMEPAAAAEAMRALGVTPEKPVQYFS
eukprot:TRINITY_DN1891_c0_g1_i2.p1 TRINITY_DN1891_c0_g1~~TRINITY_DN1891_c0_g1_i2.p1  ORF type:complete len:956 (+),score=326.66 TRINITY_DN1891_c0_g1_i2:93-2870(+)